MDGSRENSPKRDNSRERSPGHKEIPGKRESSEEREKSLAKNRAKMKRDIQGREIKAAMERGHLEPPKPEEIRFPADVRRYDVRYFPYKYDTAYTDEEKFHEKTSIENGSAICEGIDAKTKLTAFLQDRETRNISRAELQVDEEGITKIVLPEKGKQYGLTIVVGREDKRGYLTPDDPCNAPDQFAISSRTNDVAPLALKKTDIRPFYYSSYKYNELITLPDKSEAEVGAPDIVKAMKEAGINPTQVAVIGERHYYPDPGPGLKSCSSESLVVESGDKEITRITVRILHPYRESPDPPPYEGPPLGGFRGGFSFDPPRESQGTVRVTKDEWSLAGYFDVRVVDPTEVRRTNEEE